MSIKYNILNSYLFLFVFILFNVYQLYNSKVIIIPFEEFLLYSRNFNNYSQTQNYDNNKFLEENLSPKFVTKLIIGTPEKMICSVFNIREPSYYIVPNEEYRLITFNNTNLYNTYNPNKSTSFKNSTLNDEYIIYNQYYLINETIKLYSDINLDKFIKIDDIQIYLRDNLENAFSYLDISNKKNNFIINQLKEKNLINSKILSIKYNSDSSGLIIIGDYPHIYDSEHYFKEQLILFNFDTSNGKYYDILTNKISIIFNDTNDEGNKKEKKMNFQNVISFYYNLNLIIASEEYMNLVRDIFFDEYNKKKICESSIVPMLGRVYLMYFCKKQEELDLTKFPILNFNFYESNYNFELDYKDLFMEKNDIYYFLVSCDYHIDENWKIGKPFLKKYHFVFDGSKKLAGFYDQSKNINNNETNKDSFFSIKAIIIIIFITINIILIPVFYYLAKRIYIRKKLNAKELNNNYEDIIYKNTSLSIES